MRGLPSRGMGLVVISCALLLGGCTSERVSPGFQPSTLDQTRSPEQNAELYTDLIRKLIDEDRLYAAMAHLQEREQQFGRTDELRLLRADIQRKMGNGAAASAIYQQLLSTRFAGQADHGLGLIYAQDDLEHGAKYLQKAVAKDPTDARMRNDLGYARLRQGRVADAKLQLATAYQLDEKNQLNRNNYILLLLVEGNSHRAQAIASHGHVTPQTMRDLRDQARQLKARPASSRALGGVSKSSASGQASVSRSGPVESGRIGGGGG